MYVKQQRSRIFDNGDLVNKMGIKVSDVTERTGTRVNARGGAVFDFKHRLVGSNCV
jgi:hypothetical protein